jgi:hypothetical protein
MIEYMMHIFTMYNKSVKTGIKILVYYFIHDQNNFSTQEVQNTNFTATGT